MNKNPNTNKIDDSTKKQLEQFIKSGKADVISKNFENLDKEKILKMFSSLSSDDIKKGLSGGIKNVNYDALKRFMKNE